MRGGQDYSPAIDGLRAIAVLAVVAYHAGAPLPAGYIGVDVFFVISGYLITRLLHREVVKTQHLDFVAFYARRARRILPALVSVIAVTVAVSALLLPPLQAKQTGEAAAASFAFAANIYFDLLPNGYFDGDLHGNPLLHLWSLGVEEQFYLLWPVVLMLARRRPAIALTIIAGGSFVIAECLILSGLDQSAFFQAPARAWELAAGGLIAVTRPKVPNWTGSAGLATVAIACMVALPHFPGLGAMPAVIGSAMVIAASDSGHRTRALELRLMVWIGLISYSLYLWHWPVMVLGGGMPMWSKLALSFILAAASYRFVEMPFRTRWRIRPSRTVFASIGLVVAGVLSGTAIGRHYQAVENYGQDIFDAVANAEIKLRPDCDEWYYTDTLNPCIYGDDAAQRTVVLVGDSVAMQWFGAVHEIFIRDGWNLVVFTKSACPMVDAPIFYDRLGRQYTECATWRSHLLDWVDRESPDLIIVGSSNAYEFTEEQWRRGTRAVLRRMAAASERVVLMRSTPVLSPGGHDSHNDVHLWQSQAAASIANTTVVDMNPFVCPGDDCPRQINGVTTYRDRTHLTPVFVESLAPTLRKKLGLDAADDR